MDKRLAVSILSLFFLTVLLLSLVDLFTFRLRPSGHLSGNGNPALLFVIGLIPLYAVFAVLVGIVSGSYFKRSFLQGKFNGLFLFLLLVLGAVFSGLELLYARQMFYSLGGFPDQPKSAIYGWTIWNQYTNTAFFNVITYTLGIIVSILVGYAAALAGTRFSRKR